MFNPTTPTLRKTGKLIIFSIFLAAFANLNCMQNNNNLKIQVDEKNPTLNNGMFRKVPAEILLLIIDFAIQDSKDERILGKRISSMLRINKFFYSLVKDHGDKIIDALEKMKARIYTARGLNYSILSKKIVQDLKSNFIEMIAEFAENKNNISFIQKTDPTTILLNSIDASKGNIDLVNLALSNGAKIEAAYLDRNTALVNAAKYQHQAIFNLLMEKDANIHAKNHNDDTTILIYACEYMDVSVVDRLLKKGAKIHATNRYGLNALMKASYKRDQKEVAELLIKNGININAVDQTGSTALMNSAWYGRKDMLELLIKKGAEVNHTDNYGKTALMCAVDNGHQEIVEILLAAGAKINEKDHCDFTALLFALAKNRKKMARFLIQKGADLNVKTHRYDTPLMFAERNGDTYLAEFFIKKGADVNAKNKNGETALDFRKKRLY